MRITLLTYGSRGDVQPFLALAVGLQRAGHRVTLAAPQRFAAAIAGQEVRCAPLAGDPDELSRMFNDAGRNTYRMVRSLQTHVLRIAPEVVRGARQAVQGADLLVHSFAFTTGGHSLARELGLPDVSVQLFPVFAPTRAFPAIGAPRALPGWLNYFSHWFFTQVFWRLGNAGYYQLRRQAPADFPARVYWPFAPSPARAATPLVFAISPVVLGRPADWDAALIHLPGYFFLDEPAYQPPEALWRFLEAGEPPLCVTFGSMVNRAAERITRAVLEAVRRAGQRAIFLTGWGGWRPAHPPAHALFLDAAPHDWLFPRCQAVMHHGGAGTTAAGLRAGVPVIVIPHAADQPFWGDRCAALGVGPRPLPVGGLTVEALEQALGAAKQTSVRRRAQAIGDLIRAEDGVRQAVALIERQAGAFGR